MIRRRNGNVREGPGQNGASQYISPMSQIRNNFEPLPTIQDVEEAHMPQTFAPAHYPAHPVNNNSRTLTDRDLDAISEEFMVSNQHSAVSPRPLSPLDDTGESYRYPSSDLGGAIVGGGGTRMEADQIPLTTPIDDFSHGFGDAFGDVRNEQQPPPPPPQSSGSNHEFMAEYPGPRHGAGGNPLWQQNRTPSRGNQGWI